MHYSPYGWSKPPRKNPIWTMLKYIGAGFIGGVVVLLLLPFWIEKGMIAWPVERVERMPSLGYEQKAEHDGGAVPAMAGVEGEEEGNNKEAQNSEIVVPHPSLTVIDAVNQVKPAVVGVINHKQGESWMQGDTTEAGLGTGVIFEKANGKAKVITNYHVISGAKSVAIALVTGERIPAVVLGQDEITDLAVLEISDEYIEAVAQFGESAPLQPGETAIAIGNPLGLAFSQTVTVGVISSVDRALPMDFDKDGQMDWELDVIQTDAAINPGNSGGALVNLDGKVIGINSLKIADTGVEGLGFAIPMDDAKPIIEQLIAHGKVKRPFMGITPRDLLTLSDRDRERTLGLPGGVTQGVVLVGVNGPALGAGLQQLDVIVQLDDVRVGSSAALRKYLYGQKTIGDTLIVHYYRGSQLRTTRMKLVEMKVE